MLSPPFFIHLTLRLEYEVDLQGLVISEKEGMGIMGSQVGIGLGTRHEQTASRPSPSLGCYCCTSIKLVSLIPKIENKSKRQKFGLSSNVGVVQEIRGYNPVRTRVTS